MAFQCNVGSSFYNVTGCKTITSMKIYFAREV